MSIEAMKQALDALSFAWNACDSEWVQDEKIDPAVNALRQAIEQAEKQEPYGWVSQHTVKGPYEWQFNKELGGVYQDNAISILPVYTTPPTAQREWVGLTDEENRFINDQHYNIAFRDFDADVAIARAIEAKLKEKNT